MFEPDSSHTLGQAQAFSPLAGAQLKMLAQGLQKNGTLAHLTQVSRFLWIDKFELKRWLPTSNYRLGFFKKIFYFVKNIPNNTPFKMCVCTTRMWRPEEVSYPLELKLQAAALSSLTWSWESQQPQEPPTVWEVA